MMGWPSDAEGAATPQPRHDVTWVELDGEVAILDERTREVYVLNTSAAAVWMQLDGDRTLHSIARSLADRAGRDETEILTDVRGLADELRSRGLLTESRPHGT